MKRILVTGAGGAPACNYIRSLRLAPEPVYVIGADCDPYSLCRAESDAVHLLPRASDTDYLPALTDLIQRTDAEMVFVQPDPEIAVISEHRSELGALTFLPAPETVTACQNKFDTFESWRARDLRVPETLLVTDAEILESTFRSFSPVWLRPMRGAAGRGAFLAETLEQATFWLNYSEGWGSYTAAEYLSPDSVTWQSIWWEGDLIVAQGRRRLYWEFGDRAPSGVTGITGAAVTVSDPVVDGLARRAILAVDANPHGIFSVDFTYDRDGVPNPTEINIGRFFTTHLFFTMAGLNMPYIAMKLAFEEPIPPLPVKINPLPPGLLWIRGMDREPVLCDVQEIDRLKAELARTTAGEKAAVLG